jgi:hypothetical protein
METWMTEMAAFAAAVSIGAGPTGVLLALLNRRDRRQAALADAAWTAMPRDLAAEVVVEARCGLLVGAGQVRVDMRGATRDVPWETVSRLRGALPAAVRLIVEGRLGRPRPARLTIDVGAVAPAQGAATAPASTRAWMRPAA